MQTFSTISLAYLIKLTSLETPFEERNILVNDFIS